MKIQDRCPAASTKYSPDIGQGYSKRIARMTTYKTTNNLNPTDTAYIAGLIDGEGTITLTRKHKNENRQLAITISNTEKELLNYVLATVGCGKITNKRTTSHKHAPSYTYAIYNRQALALLEQITPFLKTYKLKRAKLILKDYLKLPPRNGKYTPELKSERLRFENGVLNIKPE